jgi:hypothetical protein
MASVEQVLGVSVGELHNFFERDFRDMLVMCQLVEEGVRLVGRITVFSAKERAAARMFWSWIIIIKILPR